MSSATIWSLPLYVHVIGGTVGLLSGIVAVSAAKGERLHRIAGTAFFVGMLFMAGFGAYLAVPLQQWNNVIGGVFAFYLVSTAWMTVRRRPGTTGTFEIVAMLVAFAGAVGILILGFQALANPKAVPANAPIPAFFVLAGIAGLAAALDFKVILQGGISGVARTARHLWRMCVALFAASSSFYVQVFLRKVHMPAFLHHSPLLYIPIFAPLLLLPFWLIRVRFTNWYKNGAPAMGVAP
ncbi:MAG TPA: hypothetical protein VII56_19885 [Rhizomicrobium sp.]